MTMIFSSDSADFAAYYEAAEPKVRVHSATTWLAELERRSSNPVRLTGAKLPWRSTHENVRFREGEVTVWAGINSSGKSQLAGFVALAFCAQNERTCIASFEMSPVLTLERMQRQAACCETPAKTFLSPFMGFLDGKLWLYDRQGQVDARDLYAVIRYCARELGVKHFFIDNLQKCIRGHDDYTAEKVFVDMLTSLAREEMLHIHLVHHIKKGDRDDRPPTKWDVKGSGSIVDQPDQLIIVWRNRPKELEIIKTNGQPSDEVRAKPDVLLCVEKNRNGEWDGRIPLWYHRESLQYLGNSHGKPINLMGALT